MEWIIFSRNASMDMLTMTTGSESSILIATLKEFGSKQQTPRKVCQACDQLFRASMIVGFDFRLCGSPYFQRARCVAHPALVWIQI